MYYSTLKYFLLFLCIIETSYAGFTDMASSFIPPKKPDPQLGIECAVCEDVLDTFKGTFPCPDSDVGDKDGSSSTDAGDDIHCTFKCTMLCTGDEESCLKRRELCEKGQKGIDTSKSLYTHIWQANTCNMDIVDVCARLSTSLQMYLGFAPLCTETDYNLLTSEDCRDNVNCEAAKNSEIDDSCFTCMWLFKSTPLFAGQCEPPGLKTCDKFRKKVAEEDPITKEKYIDDIPDPWSMPPWAQFGTLGQVVGSSGLLGQRRLRRRRRRLLSGAMEESEMKVSEMTEKLRLKSELKSRLVAVPPPPFTKDDERGIGSLKLNPLKKSMSFPGNCMKLWRQMEASPSGQIFARRMDDTRKACKCMCQCPYTTGEWLELQPICENIVAPNVYPFVLGDTLGRKCKGKKNDDQEKFEQEAEDAAEAVEEGPQSASSKKSKGKSL
jgi:hypothetical protein